MALMEGKVNLTMPFNINGKEINGCVKYNDRDTFIEISYEDDNGKPRIVQKLYNGSLENKEQMISEIENLIEEYLDIEE